VATVAKTLPTTVTPDFGWQALTLRADKGDLLACGTVLGVIKLYAIDFSPFTATADGTATFLRDGPTGSTCDGIAWDPADKTIYQSSTGSNVLHLAETATAPAPPVTSVPSGCPDGLVSGVGIAGASLFVACPAPAIILTAFQATSTQSIRQLDKTNGTNSNFVRSFAAPAGTPDPGGLADDPVSFGLQFKEALWTKDESSTSIQLLALEIPGGTSGQKTGPPALFPAACTGGTTPDTDGDGLLDCWEDGTLWPDGLPGISFNGIYDGNLANRDLILCVDTNGNGNFGTLGSAERATECASPRHKDIFVEIDYMQFHKPDPVAVNNVVLGVSNVAGFANAPITNPDATTGIRLHVQIGEQLAHTDKIALVPCTPAPAVGDANFDILKAAFFGTPSERSNPKALEAKRFAFHYAIFAHNQSGTSTSSGCAEVAGNDILVTLGSYAGTVTGHTGGIGSTDQQAGTFMHELGHNLNLRHGGADNINCKPNYQSVMSYTFQFATPVTTRPLDYSRQKLFTLNEASLSESVGVGGGTGQTAFGPPTGFPAKPTVASATGAINWNRNSSSTDTGVSQDIDQLTSVGCPATTGETLEGFNDWANIQLNFRASVDFADGAHITFEEATAGGTLEMTHEDAQDLSLDTDADGILDIDDNCPRTLNPFQEDSVGDGIGDACRLIVKVLTQNVSSTSAGQISVTVLSTPTRDTTKIDPATMTLHGSQVQGNGIWLLHVGKSSSGKFLCNVRNVNSDKRQDLVCTFDFDKGALPPGVSTAILEAKTFAGEPVRGQDSIRVLAR